MDSSLCSDTAKRLSLKAQGCCNPGVASLRSINPERVAPLDATAMRLNRLFGS